MIAGSLLLLACLAALATSATATSVWPTPSWFTHSDDRTVANFVNASGQLSFACADRARAQTHCPPVLTRACGRFLQTVHYEGAPISVPADGAYTGIVFIVDDLDTDFPTLGIDESYVMKADSLVTGSNVVIEANTYAGAIYALQSLAQLLEYDYDLDNGTYTLPVSFFFDDDSRYPWRGLMLDSARHFLAVDTIKTTLDLMAAIKLNVLHWHLSDAQSFPIEIAGQPELAEGGAYRVGSRKFVYSAEDVKGIVRYAADRAIRVVPEFDVPGHAAGWHGVDGIVVDCPVAVSNINNAALDPTLGDVHRHSRGSRHRRRALPRRLRSPRWR
jgi:hypothetical protein